MECRPSTKMFSCSRRAPKSGRSFFASEFWDIVSVIDKPLIDKWQWLSTTEKNESFKYNFNLTSEGLENEIKAIRSECLLMPIKILLEIYLRLKSDNPLKHSITSFLARRLKGEGSYILHTIITDILTSRCTKYDAKFNLKDKKIKVSALMLIREFADFLHFLSTCIDLDMLPAVTSEMCIFSIVKAAEPMFTLCMAYQRNEKAPLVTKEEKLDDLHALTQQLIIMLQEKSAGELPPSFLEACINLIKDPILPMNTKFNCGIIICLASKSSIVCDIFQLAESQLETSPLTAVSLCSGIISSHFSANSSLKLEILRKLLTLFVAVDKKHSSDCKMVLAVSRAVNIMSKNLLLRENFVAIKEFLDSLMNYLVPHLDSNVDAVRHLSSETYSNIILLVSKSKDEECLEKIVIILSEIPGYRRAKFTIISYSVGHITVERLLKAMPNLRDMLLEAVDKFSGAKHVLFAFEHVVKQHFLEVENKKTWFNFWVIPLIKGIHDDPGSALYSVLGEVLKLYPEVFNYILTLSHKEYPNKMKVVFSCLHTTIKLGLTNVLPPYKKDNSKILGGIVPFSVVNDSLHHRDDDIRLTLLGLLIDMPKRTCEFSSKELELLKTFFKYNVHNQWPSFRQKFISYFKKFVIRFNDSSSNCLKVLTKYENRPPEASTKDMSKERSTLKNYKKFKDWILEFAYDNLFEGASFSRRNTLLQMLSVLKQNGLLIFDSHDTDSHRMCNTLVRILSTDTYEENKQMAKDLLKGVSLEVLQLDICSPLQKNKVIMAVSDCFKMVSSIRPPDCISAAYCLSVLLEVKAAEESILTLAISKDCSPKKTHFQMAHYSVLSLLAKQLSDELLIAQLDLGQAARAGPMYGLLFMARHILQDVELQYIDKDDDWQRLMKKLMKLAINCTQAVAAVVNNSSPEGHLPMDLSQAYTTCLSLKGADPHITSQLLLLCSWRTVKEACLLLGDIVKGTPVQLEDDHFCSEDVVLIGKHLTSLLAEIKHRGAFEQVYIGFCNLATVLWKDPNGEMSNMPKKWLDDTLTEISSNNSNLCATRRSAGIPFIVQALICSEKDLTGGKKFSNIFHSTISNLIKLGLDNEVTSETRIHSMNILRSLFRNSQLGDHVSFFVDQGFMIAFNSFPSNNWSERNSATLLFSALMTRVFGVIRSKSFTLNWKNKMTSRIFFQRYPVLYGVILEKLSRACETNLQTVFPVLLLLGRLYPSSLEGTDSILELDKFIPFVNKCSSSKIIIVRNLAASALVGLLTPKDIPQQICLVLDMSKSISKENHLHGLLLQVHRLVKFGLDLPDDCGPAFDSSAKDWFQIVYDHFFSNHSLIVKGECLKVMQLLLDYASSENCQQVVQCILKTLSEIKNTSDLIFIGSGAFISTAVTLLIMIVSRHTYHVLEECFVHLLKLESYEVFQVVADLLLHIFNQEYEPSCQDIYIAVDYLKKTNYQDIKCDLKNSSPISDQMLIRLYSGTHHEDVNKILMCSKEMNHLVLNIVSKVGGVSEMLELYFMNGTDKLKSSCLNCICSYMRIGGKCNDKDIVMLGKVLNDSVFMDYDIRVAAATIIANLYARLVPSCNNITTIEIWNAILHFVCDDSQDVRDIMSPLVNNKDMDALTTLQNSFALFKKTSPSPHVLATALAYWSVAPFIEDYNYSLCPQQEEKAFDKGDTNSYKEDLLICQLSCESMSELFAKSPDVLKKPLPEELVNWLEDFHPIDVEECRMQYKNTIYGFLCVVTMSVSDDFNFFDSGYGYFSYFNQTYCDISLRTCKSSHIIKILQPHIIK